MHALKSGTLWQRLTEQSALALQSGALVSIETEHTYIEDGGVRFMVRIARNLQRKADDRVLQAVHQEKTGNNFNPFLPPEPDLTVGVIPPNHIGVLNKFNVVENHLLIITRDFVDQETLLTKDDFFTLCWSLNKFPSLAFYNGGVVGGASQSHKHLQLVPLPLCGAESSTPMDALFTDLSDAPQEIDALPYAHRIAALADGLLKQGDAADMLYQLYREMLEDLSLSPVERDGLLWQSSPYNLLVTRDWMLLVPRSREKFDGISVNSLGFAGSLFVFDDAALQRVREIGPMQVLKGVVES